MFDLSRPGISEKVIDYRDLLEMSLAGGKVTFNERFGNEDEGFIYSHRLVQAGRIYTATTNIELSDKIIKRI